MAKPKPDHLGDGMARGAASGLLSHNQRNKRFIDGLFPKKKKKKKGTK